MLQRWSTGTFLAIIWQKNKTGCRCNINHFSLSFCPVCVGGKALGSYMQCSNFKMPFFTLGFEMFRYILASSAQQLLSSPKLHLHMQKRTCMREELARLSYVLKKLGLKRPQTNSILWQQMVWWHSLAVGTKCSKGSRTEHREIMHFPIRAKWGRKLSIKQ